MSSDTPIEKASTPKLMVATLSPYALYHLNAAKLSSPAVVISQNLSSRFATLKVSGKDKNDACLTEFTLFAKLPVEIQDEIWKIYVEQNPREVGLPATYTSRYKPHWNAPVVLRQINRKLRAEAMTLHGYVSYYQPNVAPYTSPPSFIIHPKLDMLYVAGQDVETFESGFRGPSGVVNAMNEIRCLAVDLLSQERARTGNSLFEEKIARGIEKWNSLELVFLVLPESGSFSRRDAFRFKVVDVESASGIIRAMYMSFRKALQEKWARGKERISPQIEFVHKAIEG